MNWSKDDITDLEGKKAIVTGANSGLGYATTEVLADNNAEVIMACRNMEKGNQARKEIEDRIENPNLEVMELDLANLSSVKSFAESYLDEYDSLDILCNNAGVMALPRRETEDGFEMQLGINHLGHFAITGHLIDELIESEGRIVNQSSMAHEGSKIDFNDLMGKKNYSKWEAYGQSKLANLLFAFELDRRLENTNVESVGCHPGISSTNLFENGPEMSGSKIKGFFQGLFGSVVGQSPAKGCLPMVYAATSNDINGGEYVGPSGLGGMRGSPELQKPSEEARDRADARKLWDKSEELTGINYEIDSS